MKKLRNKTEDIIKEAQVNGDILKQIINDKVTTPREGISVRSGLNSERKRYEQQQKLSNSEHEKSSSQSRETSQSNEFPSYIPGNLDDKEINQMIDKFGNKEIDLIQKKGQEENKSDSEDMISVDTPIVPSDDQNSSSNNAENIILDPKNTGEDSSHDSKEAVIHSNKPISFEIRTNEDPIDDINEPKKPEDISPFSNTQALSRK